MIKFNFKSQNSSLKNLKSSLACYDVSENRFFESNIKKIGNNTLLDFGLKHTLRSNNLKLDLISSHLTTSQLKNFETPYNDILCDFDAYRKIQVNNELLSLFKEKFYTKKEMKEIIDGIVSKKSETKDIQSVPKEMSKIITRNIKTLKKLAEKEGVSVNQLISMLKNEQ